MDLIRDMLKTVEQAESPVAATTFADEQHSLELVLWHARLLDEAGLADVRIRTAWDGQLLRATIGPLTWKGCEWVDAVSDDNLWGQVKRLLATTVSGVTLDTVKTLAVKLAEQKLGL